ncbi:MAG: ABC transporter permease [Hyphomicrobiales bacterium]
MTDTALPPSMPASNDPRAGDAGVSHWRLTWRAFKKHRLARWSLWAIALLYLIGMFAEVVAPHDPSQSDRRAVYHPPQLPGVIVQDDDGWRVQLHVQAYERTRDPVTLATTYVPSGEVIPLALFARGDPYRLWGVFPADRHFLAPANASARVHFFGADRLGRDVLSRTIYGLRVSLSIGLVGVTISLLLGVTLGAISGYFGGWIDTLIQRLVELMMSIPTIPIYLGLAAAIPADLPPIWTFVAIVVILSLIGWTELARITRGKMLAMRNEDYVVAARLDAAPLPRVMFRHMLPAITSQIIASVTLAIPMMIVVETSLSFLGLGLRPPTLSWGVLLQEAQNVRSLAAAPWLFLPGVFVIFSVLAFNFVGDGLRDAADPYGPKERG